MYTGESTTRGGMWLLAADDSKITYRVDPGGETTELVFFGPVELGVGLTAASIRRCRDLLGEALTEMDRLRRDEPGLE